MRFRKTTVLCEGGLERWTKLVASGPVRKREKGSLGQGSETRGVPKWSRIRLPMQEMQDTWVCFLSQEDALEKEMASHSSILAWKIPWMEEPGGPWPMELQRVRHD